MQVLNQPTKIHVLLMPTYQFQSIGIKQSCIFTYFRFLTGIIKPITQTINQTGKKTELNHPPAAASLKLSALAQARKVASRKPQALA